MVTLEKPAFIESDVNTWSDADYKRLLSELDSIFNAKSGEPAFKRLDILATLIEEYEEKRYSIRAWLGGGKSTDIDLRSVAKGQKP